jgi:DNA-binding response OmpR family regulator
VRAHRAIKTTRRYPVLRHRRRTILYIGGDTECRILLSRIVKQFDDLHLTVSETGREGRLRAVSLAPNLILLDDELSDCDPHDLMIYLGRTTLRATVPVAVISGGEADRMRYIRAGAVAWITKPLMIDEVRHSMMTLLDLYSAR